MKNFFYLFLLILISTSCSKDSNSQSTFINTDIRDLRCDIYSFLYNPDVAANDQTSDILKIVARNSIPSGFSNVEVLYFESVLPGVLMINAQGIDESESTGLAASLESLAKIPSLDAECNLEVITFEE